MNLIFPTAYSTLSSISLAELISRQYGFTNVECNFLARGVNDTYQISSTSGRAILRVYRTDHRTFSQIEAEVELLLILKRSDVSVAYPIPDLNGNFIQDLNAAEGIRHAVLFIHAPGECYPSLITTQLQALGTEMAKFHLVSSSVSITNKRWNFDTYTTITDPLVRIEKYFSIYPEGYTWLHSAANEIQLRLENLDTSGFTTGYCHFDFFPKNFHFTDDSITFFDFDFFGYGWIVNDIMTFWVHLSFDVYLKRISQEAANKSYNIFLESYSRTRTVTENELALVPLLSFGFWLYYFGFYTSHDHFLPLLQNPHLQGRTNMIRTLMEKYL